MMWLILNLAITLKASLKKSLNLLAIHHILFTLSATFNVVVVTVYWTMLYEMDIS